MAEAVTPSREDALLLMCSRTTLSAPAAEQVRSLSRAVDWQRVISSADTHIVWPLVFASLARAHVDLPTSFARRFRDLPALVTRDNLAALSQLHRLFEMFDAEGIPCLTWKGPVFTALAYGSLPVRKCCDVDLLVPSECIGDAQRLMHAHGYTYRPHVWQRLMPRVWNEWVFLPSGPGKVPVEIHPSIALWCAMAQPPTADLLARAVPVSVAGRMIRTLSREDTLIAVVLHGAFHWWMRLRLVADLDAAARSVTDWAAVAMRAREIGIMRLLRVAVLLGRDLLDTPVPGAVLEEAERDSTAVWLTGRLAMNLSRPTRAPAYPGDVIALLSHDRLSHRVLHTLRLFVWRGILTRAERVATSAESAARQAPAPPW